MIEAVQAIQSAINIVGKLRDLSKKVGDADFKMLLADLSCDLADAKLDTANLKAEMAALREENTELRARIETRENSKPKLVDSVYQFEGDEGHYCTACHDTTQRRVRVSEQKGPFAKLGKWICPLCKATYG